MLLLYHHFLKENLKILGFCLCASGCGIIVFMENMKPTFFQNHPVLKDILSLVIFIATVVVGTIFLNTYLYRSYNVVGSSMENTLHEGDRVIVNRAAVTWAHLTGNEYVPERGQIIVFANADETAEKLYQRQAKADELGVDVETLPISDDYSDMGSFTTCDAPTNVTDQYIIKRVIAFPGERVVVKDGVMTIYTPDENGEFGEGVIYDRDWRVSDTDGPKEYTSGEVDMIVPAGELFVSGDNREGSNSWDSRNGLGTIPYCRIVGPVALRLFPLNQIRTF